MGYNVFRPFGVAGLALLFAACGDGKQPMVPEQPSTPLTGELSVAVTTVGPTPDPDGYVARLDDRTLPLEIDGRVSFPDLEPGEYAVELDGLATNCSVVGGNPRVGTVEPGEQLTIVTEVSCPFAQLDRLLWRTNRDGNSEIYSMDVDGSDSVNLTNNPYFDGMPSVAPDGRTIAFSSTRFSGETGVYVIDADGANPQSVAPAVGADDMPEWSPDGRFIAFQTNRDDIDGDLFDIYVVDVEANLSRGSTFNGTPPRRLTTHPSNDLDPTWSPDGTRIAFTSHCDGNAEIYAMNADGSNQVNLTNDPGDDFSPDWSPDGTKIVFSRIAGGDLTSEIFVMNVDGTGLVNLTNDPGTADRTAKWSPDGTKIAFVSFRDGNSDIFVMNADGSDPVNVTNHPASDVEPAWSPR